MSHTVFTLHITSNYPDGKEEDYGYQTRFELDDLLGIVKTYMEFADKASSFVFTVVKESAEAATERLVEEDRLRSMGQWDSDPEFWDRDDEHREEGTKAHFDRYVAGDK